MALFTILGGGTIVSGLIDKAFTVDGLRKWYVKCSGDMTDVKLVWKPKDITRSIWVFGDSYVGTYNPARWPYQLKQLGYLKNVLIDGISGGGSTTGMNSFERLLKLG